MERGVGTGERVAENRPIVGAGTSHRAMTERILEVADGAGPRAALVNAADGTVTVWPRFARTVRAAACGLGRRGLAGADTAGVLVEDAASAAIAVNAIRAAGAAACLIRYDADPAEVIGRLNACGARVLITSAPLAGLATVAADSSRVRQVISFGEAAGTTPFSSLLRAGRPAAIDESGRPEGNGLTDHHGTGGLTHRNVVVAAPPCGEGQAYVSLLDLTLLAGATLVAAPATLVPAAMRVYRGTAAIVPRGAAVPGIPLDRLFPVALPGFASWPGWLPCRIRCPAGFAACRIRCLAGFPAPSGAATGRGRVTRVRLGRDGG